MIRRNSDADIRSLERAVASDPYDEIAIEKLFAARVRAGIISKSLAEVIGMLGYSPALVHIRPFRTSRSLLSMLASVDNKIILTSLSADCAERALLTDPIEVNEFDYPDDSDPDDHNSVYTNRRLQGIRTRLHATAVSAIDLARKWAKDPTEDNLNEARKFLDKHTCYYASPVSYAVAAVGCAYSNYSSRSYASDACEDNAWTRTRLLNYLLGRPLDPIDSDLQTRRNYGPVEPHDPAALIDLALSYVEKPLSNVGKAREAMEAVYGAHPYLRKSGQVVVREGSKRRS